MQSWGTSTSEMDYSRFGTPTQDHVLGNFQPSLRDCSLPLANPGLTSWATLSRPYGTQFEEGGSHADTKALTCCLHKSMFSARPNSAWNEAHRRTLSYPCAPG